MSPQTGSSAFVEACAASFRARLAAERAAAAERASGLLGRARAAARRLATEHGASKVWLFGSLAWGQAHAASDVDLLVEGLPAETWSAASALLEAEVGAAVDLVRVEEAPPGLEERVRSQGVLLHGAR